MQVGLNGVQVIGCTHVFVQICAEVRMSAETSMGTEMTEEDLLHINSLACRVEELVEYRANLAEYLKVRMKAVAPNLTHMVSGMPRVFLGNLPSNGRFLPSIAFFKDEFSIDRDK